MMENSVDRKRDIQANIEVELTEHMAYEKESPTAQLTLEPPQALSGPKITVDFLDATIELELDDYHIDMLADYTYRLQEIKKEE